MGFLDGCFWYCGWIGAVLGKVGEILVLETSFLCLGFILEVASLWVWVWRRWSVLNSVSGGYTIDSTALLSKSAPFWSTLQDHLALRRLIPA